MEAAAARGGSLPTPSSQPHRKEWRAVSDHPFRKNESEEPEHGKLGQSDERTIYEEGTGPLDVELCSVAIDGSGLSNDILQQRLPDISRQRQELQQMEIELRAQIIARSEIAKVQSNFDTQIKEHINASAILKEQLHEREQCIQKLEMKLEEKESELRAVRIDNEAAWAKDDLLREQNKELATFRRERENSEAERTQHLKQIHELQEHIQEKINQFLELEEQHRVAQEAILYKDEQLREAQAWVARAQEMDTFHSTTNQTLQAELRERIEQFNQYLMAQQRQFAEVDRLHRQAIQQLQLELAEARGRNGIHNDDSLVAPTGLRDSSSYVNKGNHFINDGTATNDSSVLVTKGEHAESFLPASGSSSKAEHAPAVSIVPSSLLGLGAFLPSGQVIAPHPFVMHSQGTQQSVAQANLHGPESQLAYFHPITTITSHQHRQNHQAQADTTHQISHSDQHQPSQAEQNISNSDAQYNYELSAERQAVNSDHVGSHKSSTQGPDPDALTSGLDGTVEVLNGKELESNVNRYSRLESQGTTHEDSQFQTSLGLDLLEKSGETKVSGETTSIAANQVQEQVLTSKQTWSASNVTLSTVDHSVNSTGVPKRDVNTVKTNELPVSAVKTGCSSTFGKVPEPPLMDEKSLLACIVRAIPAGPSGGIRISSTLPNRLGKMLAPLHWHDYKKQYGKLDDFVTRHPELFVIKGDFIHLREGAQEIISTTTAVAKVAAAAAASVPHSSLLPSVAVTPVAQTHRLRKVPSTELKTGNPETSVQVDFGDSSNRLLHISTLPNQQPNGVGLNVINGLSDLKISKSRNLSSALSSETRSAHPTVRIVTGNGSSMDRSTFPSSQNRGSSNGRHGFGGKQQGR